jgi:hypothetical protein
MFRFAFLAYGVEHVTSVRGSARKFVENAYTAKSKAWRFLKNENLRELLPELLTKLALVNKDSIIAIDFSSFGRWQVLMFAIQTRRGRAIPVFFKIITYPIQKDSQNLFIVEAVEEFVSLVKCKPKLVFDRGFACPHIIKILSKINLLFYIRIKAGKHVKVENGQSSQARGVDSDDNVVEAYGLKLRLIVSDKPSNDNEEWFIVTNDMCSERKTIIEYYYFRFEIEEFFKDAKWLQGLEFTRFMKIESITTLLWFVLIGWWCFEKLSSVIPKFSIPHPKAKISEFRHFTETLQRFRNFLMLKALGYESI